eukprot:3410045-Pyramimonas_sp.AAC.1
MERLQQLARMMEDGGLPQESEAFLSHVDFYSYMVSRPPELWLLACLNPTSPLLWSQDCDCCEPALPG